MNMYIMNMYRVSVHRAEGVQRLYEHVHYEHVQSICSQS